MGMGRMENGRMGVGRMGRISKHPPSNYSLLLHATYVIA